MSNAGFSPGPWEARIDGTSPVKITAGESIVGYAIFGPLRDVDAKYEGGVPVAEANARLIAAAPDLLSLLEMIVADEERPGFKMHNWTLPEARALIAKAKGGAA